MSKRKSHENLPAVKRLRQDPCLPLEVRSASSKVTTYLSECVDFCQHASHDWNRITRMFDVPSVPPRVFEDVAGPLMLPDGRLVVVFRKDKFTTRDHIRMRLTNHRNVRNLALMQSFARLSRAVARITASVLTPEERGLLKSPLSSVSVQYQCRGTTVPAHVDGTRKTVIVLCPLDNALVVDDSPLEFDNSPLPQVVALRGGLDEEGGIFHYVRPMEGRLSIVFRLIPPEDRDRLRSFRDTHASVNLWPDPPAPPLRADHTHVLVMTLTGGEVKLDVNLDDAIEVVKRRIQDKMGIPSGMQRLIAPGKQLEDGHTLADYKIEPGSKITLVLRLRGD